MNRTALITGICGQDGPYLAQLLLGKGYKVVGTTRSLKNKNTQGLRFLGIANEVELIEINDFSVGTRDQSILVPIQYELPHAAVTEAIVNAVAHLYYTSNGSIKVMLFKDRLEIWNPGCLPYGLTTAKLRKSHSSIPANPLLEEPMYLAGFIERIGTGTGDIIRLCEEAGLKKAPEFIQEEIFKTILWRKNSSAPETQNADVTEDRLNTIVEFIKKNNKITTSEKRI